MMLVPMIKNWEITKKPLRVGRKVGNLVPLGLISTCLPHVLSGSLQPIFCLPTIDDSVCDPWHGPSVRLYTHMYKALLIPFINLPSKQGPRETQITEATDSWPTRDPLWRFRE